MDEENRGQSVEIGDAVTFVDPTGKERPAIVTAIWRGMGGHAPHGVNVVYVSDDPARTDSYGRQVERSTSVCHQSVQPAHGNYWK